MSNQSSITTLFSTSTSLESLEFFLWQEDKPFSYCLTLVNLDELESKLADPLLAYQLLAYLSPGEKELFTGFKFPKRRREWLGGRLAAKCAVQSLSGKHQPVEKLADISILPKENGSPAIRSLSVPKEKLPPISISHSEQFAVAMVAGAKSCGIDIQKVSDKIQRVSDRFCNEEERLLLQKRVWQLNEIEQLTLLWSAKEALKKSLLFDQPVIFQGVILNSLETGRFFTLYLQLPGTKDHAAKVTAVKIDDYMLAYTITETCNA